MSLSVRLHHAFPGLTLDAAFDAPAGVTALFGRSGAGKTSVINAVAGLLRPDDGQISLDGRVLLDTGQRLHVPPHKRHLGYVFQDARLFPHMSVQANLTYGQRGTGGPTLDEVCTLLDIRPLLARRPADLSGGEKQRVAIGRALLSQPQMLLLDEPLAALDMARKAEILPYLERLRDDLNIPMLYVSHALAEIARLATTVVVLEAGKVVTTGPAEQVLSDPDMVRQLGVRNAGAVLPATVERHHPDGLTELSVAAGRLFLPQTLLAPGHKTRVRILAQDIMLSLEKPQGLSALNILPATVSTLREGDGPGVICALACGPDRLLARVTRRSAQALGLRPGLPVHAIIKAVSVDPADIGRG